VDDLLVLLKAFQIFKNFNEKYSTISKYKLYLTSYFMNYNEFFRGRGVLVYLYEESRV